MNPNTDTEWERWGQREPYFGVITDAKFRREAFTTESRKEFFDSGVAHVDYVMQMIRLHLDVRFSTHQSCLTSAAESDER